MYRVITLLKHRYTYANGKQLTRTQVIWNENNSLEPSSFTVHLLLT